MKKQLDTDQITNELKGQSLYFEAQSKRLSKKSAQKETNARTGEHTNARTDERPNARTNERLNGRTAERMNDRTDERVNARTDERVNARTGAQKKAPRIIKRHSYQFYVDQVEDMKNLWRSYQARGIEVDLAYFAREAFDEYLTRIKDKANENANVRTTEHVNDRTSERVNMRTHERPNG